MRLRLLNIAVNFILLAAVLYYFQQEADARCQRVHYQRASLFWTWGITCYTEGPHGLGLYGPLRLAEAYWAEREAQPDTVRVLDERF